MRITKSLLWLIRATLIILTLILIFQKDFLFAFSALIAAIISFAPVFVEKNYNIDFPWIIEFLIAFTLLLHILGEFFELYASIIFFSPLMHFLGTATIALLAFIIVYTLNLTKNVKLSPFMIGLFTLVFALAIGTLWEIGEFASDKFLGTTAQGDGKDPLVDTMLDLISDGITGLLVALIGASLVKGYHGLVHPFELLIKKISEKGKEGAKKLKKSLEIRIKVKGYGNKKARIMLIGEAPGAEEIRQKKPFVGRAGKLLNQILKKSKISRKKLYITNLIKVKLPNNRKPTEKEIKKWLPALKKEIKRVKPKTIVLFGETVTKSLINKKLKKIRGKILKQDNISYLATYHPSAARFPKIRKIIEKDFLLLKKLNH